jgi:hypothetical protein
LVVIVRVHRGHNLFNVGADCATRTGPSSTFFTLS